MTDFSVTVVVWRSLQITVFGTYQRASTIMPKSLPPLRNQIKILHSTIYREVLKVLLETPRYIALIFHSYVAKIECRIEP
jgi:hypothetical protein